MKIKAIELQRQMVKLGYFRMEYAMFLDPTFTYQEFLLSYFLRMWNWDVIYFDPDECLEEFIKTYGNQDYLLETYDKYYVGSKYNEKIIDKDWYNVLTDKNEIINR